MAVPSGIISMKVCWEGRPELACDNYKSDGFSSIEVTSVLKSMISTTLEPCSDLSDSHLHNSFVGIICLFNEELVCKQLSSKRLLFWIL